MEPQVDRPRRGRAPILGWTDGSPSISPAFSFRPSVLPASPSKSLGSSCPGLESSAKTSITHSSEIHSPDLSSTGCEPATFPSVNSILGCASSGDIDDGKKPMNGMSTVRTLVIENPVYEGSCVTFKDEKDGSPYSSDDSVFEAQERTKPKVPDGGWGWVIVAASFTISMIADGISFSFGLLYSEFLLHFGESKSKTAWIGSLFMSVPLLSGPIGSALVDRYGCRSMTIVGGMISGLGYVLSAFADSVVVLYFTFGLIAGLGLGFCYVTAVVSIAFWFDKKRTLATSLGACGTGIGTFVYAPMTQYFIEEYGWRGCLLLLGGTFLNMCVCGALMREPGRARGLASCKLASESSCMSVSESGGVEEMRLMLRNGGEPRRVLAALATRNDQTEQHMGDAHGVCQSVVNLPTFVRQSETVPVEVLESLRRNRPLFSVMVDKYPGPPARAPSAELGGAAVPLLRAEVAPRPAARPPGPRAGTTHRRAPTCGFVQPAHYLNDIRVHKKSMMYRGAILNLNRYRLRASSCPDIYRNSMITIAKEAEERWYDDIVELLKDMADFSLFLELHFLLMSLSTVLLFVWFIVPYFYLVEYMAQHGYSEHDASALLSVIGVTNFMGMVFLGWAGDQKWMNVTKTYAWCLVLCGLAVVAMTFCTYNWALLCVSGGLFGLFFASSFSFTPVILVQLSPLERFTNAYGLILLCQGIGNLLGPPLAALLFDVTQSWVLSFYMAGVWIVVSGLLIAAIPASNNRHLWGGTLQEP
ncbi:monocarboxylate transporter 14-like [Bacillus rossius redtenbacheri]|uniref:monocarboxylate transporter 14-like n=1 Tax=Bacillus rossius redtenbacheri TaxID=93214 RepID=UPI002FDEF065